ncbi:hypothetical protein V2J09_005478 [Rumex salicifolius]
MENEMQVEAIPKKIWSVMRGVSKRKLSLHLNFMLKRSKMAGKSLGNIMFNHQPAASAAADLFSLYKAAEAGRREYEFSCSNTPAHRKFLFKKKQQQAQYEAHYEAQYETIEEEFMNMMGLNDAVEAASASPVLPGLLGFRPIRVTDSPFPVFSGRIAEGECHVDEAADEFIRRFYSQLRRQSLTDG